MPFTPTKNYMIGPYASGSSAMVNLEVTGDTATYSPPGFTFKPYSQQIMLGDGSVRGAGWAEGTWEWEAISEIQRDWLRTYIPGQSAEVWVNTQTFDNGEAYKTFRCIAVWPVDSEERDTHRGMKFTLKLQRMTTS